MKRTNVFFKWHADCTFYCGFVTFITRITWTALSLQLNKLLVNVIKPCFKNKRSRFKLLSQICLEKRLQIEFILYILKKELIILQIITLFNIKNSLYWNKLSTTFSHNCGYISSITFWICIFNSGNVFMFPARTLCFTNFHRRKSRGVRSHDLGGHFSSPLRVILLEPHVQMRLHKVQHSLRKKKVIKSIHQTGLISMCLV